jgi:hypothetical protein
MVIECWRNIFGILRGCDEPGVSDAAAGRVQVDAGQQRGEFGGGHLDAAGRGVRNAVGAAFEPLDVGITMPSFLCRYTNSVRSGSSGP